MELKDSGSAVITVPVLSENKFLFIGSADILKIANLGNKN